MEEFTRLDNRRDVKTQKQLNVMYSKEFEELIDLVIADGKITEREWALLRKKAAQEHIDLDELEIVVEGRLAKFLNSQRNRANEATPSANSSYPTPPPFPNQNAPASPSVPPVCQPSQPSSQKHGTIRKCPNCGAIVQSGRASCSECGYAFTGLQANSAVERFSKLLREAQDKIQERDMELAKLTSRKGLLSKMLSLTEATKQSQDHTIIIDIITNFPVPSTKDDLMEFILFLEPKANASFFDGIYAYKRAYRQKLQECCRKAEFWFPDDDQMRSLLNNINRK